MTSQSGIDTAPLSVLLDLRDPASYLALHPAAALGRELCIAINWLPLAASPLRPPSAASADDDRGTIHRRHRARAIAREIDVYARAQGLVLREIYRAPDARAFDLGWLWLRERSPERLVDFLAAGFRAYWALELDPSSAPAIAALLASIGGEVAGFDSWCAGAGASRAQLLTAELRARGLFGTPGYVVGDEVFIGRQHLPMIRWLLAGRAGPGPI